eukprot:9881037-Prorocentrum_lima.AAC.1
MTSSLVGSEMCIRDSLNTRVHDEPGSTTSPPMSIQTTTIMPLSTNFHGAVSYTHLTLPTICSV